MAEDKRAIELNLLLASWKLETLYETLKNEEIFIEELEMMTMQHLERVLKDHKFGLRIRFQHHFMKWRTSIGVPLIDGRTSQQQDQDNKADNLRPKVIILAEKETQTESISMTTKTASVQVPDKCESVAEATKHYQKVILPKSKLQSTVPKKLTIEPQSTTTIHNESVQPTIHVNLETQPHLMKKRKAKSPVSVMHRDNLIRSTRKDHTYSIPKDLIEPTETLSEVVQYEEVLDSSPSSSRKILTRSGSKILTSQDSTSIENTTGKPFIPKASLKKHSSYSNYPPNCEENQNSRTSNLSLLKKNHNKTLQNFQKYKKIGGNFVIDILIAGSGQGFELLQQYEENKSFTPSEREELVQIICEYWYKRGKNLSVEDCDNVVEEILQLFPSEKEENYQKGRCGKIFKRFCNMIKEFEDMPVELRDPSVSDDSNRELFFGEDSPENLNFEDTDPLE